MAGILRGEIHWADLNPMKGQEQAGLRPVVIISTAKQNDGGELDPLQPASNQEE